MRYGQLRGSVLGMRVVLPDGKVLDSRTKMRKVGGNRIHLLSAQTLSNQREINIKTCVNFSHTITIHTFQ